MSHQRTRREFLGAAAAAGALGVGDLSFFSQLAPVSAAEAALETSVVQFRPEIEPTVKLLEETPREKLLEEVASRIRRGLSYREILTALLLAGVKNIQPRPHVGFKFHAVLVVNSAHLASLSSPESDRWLPIFWALDEFKRSQSRDVSEGNWTMSSVDEAGVPPAHKAFDAFEAAMQSWDVPAADVAVAGLARTAGANELLEVFARYGARDFRSIGHKAIFVANSWRTLQCVGWQHAEPVLRSLAYALLNHRGDPNPAQNDLAADRPGRRNAELAKQIRADWQTGERSSNATEELLALLRTGSDEEVSRSVVEMLNRGVAVQSVYDALLLGAGELLMRQPGIVALHAVTSTNALRYLYSVTGRDETRRMLLLQNAAFLPLFREAMKGRGPVGEAHIDQLEPRTVAGDEQTMLAEIFRDVSEDRSQAAQKVLGYLGAKHQPKQLIDTARRLIFLKGSNSHDYKFSSAVLEDFYHVSPEWRDRFLASSVFNLRGSNGADNQLVARTREALKA
jgi:hypothetical protein